MASRIRKETPRQQTLQLLQNTHNLSNHFVQEFTTPPRAFTQRTPRPVQQRLQRLIHRTLERPRSR